MTRYGFRAGLAIAGASALVLTACDDGRRQVAAPPPASLAELEAISDLPAAPPAQVDYREPEQGYQWAERAYGLQRAVYDAPPDYGFEYEDEEPYVWETADDWALYAEPWEGDYRYYYYEPGEAYPYFVRDRDYGYAYGPAGVLVAMFYPDGRYVPADVAYRLAPTAGRYWARGRNLRRAGLQAPRTRVDERIWVEAAPRVARSADPWLRAARDDRAWRAWRTRDDNRELRRFAPETRRRQDAAEAWRERVARTPPGPAPGQVDARGDLREGMRAAKLEQRQDRAEARAAEQQARNAAAVERRADASREAQQQQQARAEARAEQRRRQAEQRAQRQQAEQRQAQAQAQRRAQVERRQAQQAQGEQRRQAQQAQRQQAEQQRAQMAQHRQQAAQAQRAEARQQQAQRAQAERQPRQAARGPSAVERGKPVADRAGGKGKGHEKKD